MKKKRDVVVRVSLDLGKDFYETLEFLGSKYDQSVPSYIRMVLAAEMDRKRSVIDLFERQRNGRRMLEQQEAERQKPHKQALPPAPKKTQDEEEIDF